MKFAECVLPAEYKKLDVHLLGDWHVGDPLCDYALVEEAVQVVADAPETACILCGDLCDMALRSSVGDCHGAVFGPMQQVETIVSLLEPLAAQGKVLGMVSGNHERRVYKQTGIDPMAFAAAQLGISDRYSDGQLILFVRFGKEQKHDHMMLYTMLVTHGAGGGRKEGGKLQRVADLQNIADCDIYCHGHTHLPGVFPTRFLRVNNEHRTAAMADHLFVCGGASLDYGGYAELDGMKPASKRFPVIHLSGGKKKFTATL